MYLVFEIAPSATTHSLTHRVPATRTAETRERKGGPHIPGTGGLRTNSVEVSGKSVVAVSRPVVLGPVKTEVDDLWSEGNGGDPL